MARMIVLVVAALTVLAFAATCSSKQSLTPSAGNGQEIAPATPLITDLPDLQSLKNPLVVKATSATQRFPGYLLEGNNTANASKEGLDSIRLSSTEADFSAVWYGINLEYMGRNVPYLAPYSMTINTNGSGPFWVVLADFKLGGWSVVHEQFQGTEVVVGVGLEPNAGNEYGTFWCAIVAEGGSEVVIDSIDMEFPPSPITEDYITYITYIYAKDGTRLATEVYLPRENNFTPAPPPPPFPVVLLRTPYNKSNITDMRMTIQGTERSFLNWMADLNICTVTQYFRGRLNDTGEYPDSNGSETLFREHAGPEHTDAIDTIEWLEQRNFYSGDMFLTGPSALGLWVYQAATQLGDRVNGIYPQIASADVGAWAARKNGCFKQSNLIGWLGSNDYPADMYLDIKSKFSDDSFWDEVNFDSQAAGTNCPGYHETGWWDVDVSSTINSWRQINENGGPKALGNQKLIIGPWTHNLLRGNQAGGITFPTDPEINNPTILPSGWDGTLWTLNNLGRNPLFSLPDNDVLVYFMGEEENILGLNNKWVELATWPPPSTENKLFLTALGDLNSTGDIADSSLSVNCDPQDPLDNMGGELLPGASFLPGPFNQVALYGTPEIQSFRSGALPAPTVIAGEITVDIYFSTLATDTDIMVKLIDQYTPAKQMLVADSAMRLSHFVGGPVTPGQVYKVSFPIGDRAYVFEAGHRIGIDVQSSNYPRFAVNPGNGRDFIDGIEEDVIQLNQIHFGPSAPTAVYLPEYAP